MYNLDWQPNRKNGIYTRWNHTFYIQNSVVCKVQCDSF